MNVLIATPLGENGRGGIDRMMDELRREMKTNGHIGRREFITTRGQLPVQFSWLYLPFAMAKVALRKAQGRADLIHINISSHGSTLRKIPLSRFCRLLGVPYLLHVHGSRMRQYWLAAPPMVRHQIEEMFAHAARVIVLGGVWRDFIAEQVPAITNRIEIVPNATRPPKLARVPADTVRIAFLGRVGARKGVPQLIAALAALPRDGNWRAVIAGDGDVKASQDEIDRLGLAGKVSMTGWVGPQQVAELLAASDIQVLPSFDENLPMSVIEAMAAELAVVTTPVGATEDIIHHGKTGLLVPPGDVPALAAALEQLVNDADLRQRLGKAAKAFHRQHLEIAPYAEKMQQIWHEVFKENKK